MQAGAVDIAIMAILGLASSVHCAGMCGPLVAVASAPLAAEDTRRRWFDLALWQAGWHAGRGITYAAIGAALGLAGTAISRIAAARIAGGLVQVVLGAAIVAGALVLVAGRRAVKAPEGEGLAVRAIRRLVTSGRAWSMAGLGLVTGLMPCGVLYAAFARSVVAGSALDGALLMIAFWAGTVPLLFAVGYASGGILRAAGRWAAYAVLVAMLATGGWLLVKGCRTLASGGAPCPHAGARADAAEVVSVEARC